MFKGFRDFILRGNVMDLAVAVIIGAAFTAIVTAFTADIINPLLGAFLGKPSFDWIVDVHGGKVLLGAFVNAVITFLILAGVVYFFLVTPTQYLLKKFNPPAAEPPATKACPQCLGDIPVAATRCKFCTQPVV
jgi:large conductance mechanosensitive channel